MSVTSSPSVILIESNLSFSFPVTKQLELIIACHLVFKNAFIFFFFSATAQDLVLSGLALFICWPVSCYLAQAGLECLVSSDPVTSASRAAGITDAHHCIQLVWASAFKELELANTRHRGNSHWQSQKKMTFLLTLCPSYTILYQAWA